MLTLRSYFIEFADMIRPAMKKSVLAVTGASLAADQRLTLQVAFVRAARTISPLKPPLTDQDG